VVLDDEDRENEGDLIGAADKMTPESMAFMVRHTSGLVCVSVDNSTADRLKLPLMVSNKDNEAGRLDRSVCSSLTTVRTQATPGDPGWERWV
jgi:3,4-dihydroxy-2-butanone 4-phosphate synthase